MELCYFNQEIAHDAERSKERIRKVSASSEEEIASFKPEIATGFVNEREDLTAHLKAYRFKIREAQDQGLVNKPQAKRLLSGNENLDAAILKVHAALAKNRIKVEYGILSYATYLRIGEAYLAALAGAVRSQDYKTGTAE